MAIKKITENVYQVGLGPVNCFIMDDNGLTLIDTGIPNSESKIYKALAEIGKKPEDIKQIILTHLHADHVGSAASFQQLLNVPVYAHEIDAPLIEKGISRRDPMVLSPGFFPWLIFNLFMRGSKPRINSVSPVIPLQDGQVLPILSGARVIHTPGHSAGHISLLLEDEKLLIAGDICGNVRALQLALVNEDPDLALQTLKKVAGYDFNIACFGHGDPVMAAANNKFAEKFQ